MKHLAKRIDALEGRAPPTGRWHRIYTDGQTFDEAWPPMRVSTAHWARTTTSSTGR